MEFSFDTVIFLSLGLLKDPGARLVTEAGIRTLWILVLLNASLSIFCMPFGKIMESRPEEKNADESILVTLSGKVISFRL